MSRIRTIKPEFWQHPKVTSVSRDARLYFLGLLNEADDAGRLRYSGKRLSGVIFPDDEDVTGAEIDVWTDELEKAGLVHRYSVEDAPLLLVIGFTEHQKINRPSPSKLPCALIEPSPRGQGGEQEVSSPEGNREQGTFAATAAREHSFDEAFDAWWALYPRKIDKEPARKTYIARRRAGSSALDLIHAVENYAEACDGQEREHIKYAKTFLNGSWSEWIDGIPPDARPATLEELATPARPRPDFVCKVGNPECVDGWIDTPDGARACICRVAA